MIVIGIDPGIANTGFGVVRSGRGADGGARRRSDRDPRRRCVSSSGSAALHESLGELIRWHEPKAMALEDLFFGKNVGSALSVGEARGVALLAAATQAVPCFDYTPQAVKKAVCGSGSAEKSQVQRMVASLLGLPEPPAPDHAADAFAVAICHAGRRPARRPALAARAPGRRRRMIASVNGEVLVRRPDHVVVDANGVGYRLAVSAETLKSVPARGKRTSLHAHLVARDDALSLYGFSARRRGTSSCT